MHKTLQGNLREAPHPDLFREQGPWGQTIEVQIIRVKAGRYEHVMCLGKNKCSVFIREIVHGSGVAMKKKIDFESMQKNLDRST